MKKRRYRKKKRAELEEQTRLRIVASAVAVHGTVGPSQSSISAIADQAGVRRSTVYRHFPDERALFTACSSHWMAENPVPDITRWAAIHDFTERLSLALHELYGYYRRNQRMLANVFRDEATMPIVREMLGGFRSYLAAARTVLVQSPGDEASGRIREAAIGHALTFAVWRSLAMEQGLDDDECARLMCLLVQACQSESCLDGGDGKLDRPSRNPVSKPGRL